MLEKLKSPAAPWPSLAASQPVLADASQSRGQAAQSRWPAMLCCI